MKRSRDGATIAQSAATASGTYVQGFAGEMAEWLKAHACAGDGRVAEGARLESVFTRKGNVGSNPTLSARLFVLNSLSALVSVLVSVIRGI